MNQHEGSLSGPRGARIFTQSWLPDAAPRAALLISHGLAEHSGRYHNLIERLVPQGYAAYALDHLGHGRSEGQRVYVERFSDYIAPLRQLFERVRAAHPTLPIFLVGHSMGGLIAATYLLDHQAGLAGAVLSAPAVKIPDSISPAVVLVGRLLSALIPTAGILALESDGISRDPAVVRAYVEDPLVHKGKTTARLGAELIQAMQRVTREAAQITLPILLLQGTADRIVDPTGAQILHDAVGSADKAIRTYPGLFHEIFNEPERAVVLGDVEAWLEHQLVARVP